MRLDNSETNTPPLNWTPNRAGSSRLSFPQSACRCVSKVAGSKFRWSLWVFLGTQTSADSGHPHPGKVAPTSADFQTDTRTPPFDAGGWCRQGLVDCSSHELHGCSSSFLLQAHSCVEKAGMIALVKIRELDHDSEFSLRGWTLQKAIDVSRANSVSK